MDQSERKDFRRPNPAGGHGTGGDYRPRADERFEMKKWGLEFGKQLSDLSKVGAERIVEISQETGKYLASSRSGGIDLKINQIRRFLDEVRQIENSMKNKPFDPDRVILLRPKLAYAAGREHRVIPLMNVLDPAIKSAAQSAENFNKLLRLIEGIVAYHRFNEGTN
jgi:CRISPR-associated protein Csm2